MEFNARAWIGDSLKSLYISLFLLMIFSLCGCALGVRDDSAKSINARVVVLPNNQDVIALDANDTVKIMKQAGFSDDLILSLGTDLRNSLATSGAAQINVDDKVEAIFAVRGSYIHISTYRRGNFIFDSKTGEIR